METDTSPADITKRLEALSKWHHEYRTILKNKNEQAPTNPELAPPTNMPSNNTMQTIELLYANEDENDESMPRDISGVLAFDETPRKSSTGLLSKPTSGYVTSDSKIGDTDSAQSIPKTANTADTDKVVAPKRYLRKGEGIKQRFKIEPDAFNLKKLPPYKFAKAHAQLNAAKPKRKRPIKKVKIAQQVEIVPLAAPTATAAKLDTHEIHFQRLLFASSTVCNSTPDSKSSSMDKSLPLQQLSNNTQNSTEVSSLDMAWSKVLDPLQIRPISVKQLRVQQNETAQQQQQRSLNDTEDDNLNLFELLEEKAKEGSFNLNCSLVRRILTKKIAGKIENDENSDVIPVSKQLRESHLEPQVEPNELVSSSSASEQDESGAESCVDDDADSECVTEDDDDDGDDGNEHENENETTLLDEHADDSGGKSNAACLHVRFVDERKQKQHRSKDETLENQSKISMDNSNVNSTAIFEQMKELVRAALEKHENSGDASLISSPHALNAAEIKQLAEQGRQRVAELENEIALFKETNLQLMKAKQEHEMEKVHMLQQHEEALEHLNDERIQMEIELHDERMKLEKERRKNEEKLRMHKAALVSSERKEIARLKEEIVGLQNKLRDKDQNHTAAQARLRSQLRVLEKEQKNLYDEIERLGKENKKLEKQIAHLQREQNTTMLSEINRNLLKLSSSSKNLTNSSNNNKEKESSKSSSKSEQAAPKPTMQKRANSKRTNDDNSEALKTLKITASSFTNLMPANFLEKAEVQKKQLDEVDDDDVDDDVIEESKTQAAVVSRHADLVESLTYSPTNEKENINEESNTNISSFKNLTREITNADGGKEIIYPNGTIRKESGDGLLVRMMYFNGDVKETNVKEGTIKYYYSKTNTWHTTYLDGLEIIEFPNGQIEHRMPSGIIEVHYPHKNCIKIMDPKDTEKLAEYIYDDGTKVCEMRNGNKLLTMPNGQKELTTNEFKRREYPDGTVKTVYPDGSHETRYSNGRLRLKDKDGNLIIDSEVPQLRQPSQQQQRQQQQTIAGFN